MLQQIYDKLVFAGQGPFPGLFSCPSAVIKRFFWFYLDAIAENNKSQRFDGKFERREMTSGQYWTDRPIRKQENIDAFLIAN